MERVTHAGARALAAAPLAILALALLGCSDLNLKGFVEQKVLEYDLSQNPRPILALKDGATTIAANGTVTMPNTIFGDPGPKALTIQNQGNLPLTLSGPPYVSVTGGAGAAAYSVVQPAQSTIPAGGSTTFNVVFTPPAADLDYAATLVVNSNDPANGAYGFGASGHSTQWHGKTAVVSSPSAVYQSPQIAIAGSYIYVTYMDSGIKLKKSTDGGKTWSSATTLVPTSYWHSIAASGNNFHLFYHDPAGHSLQYCKSESNGGSLNYVRSFPVDTNQPGIMNSAIVLSGGSVYLCFYDTTNSKLQVSVSSDVPPLGMGFGT
ncbi:MAG: choice-of-anchor D domain-containing protein, partial [Candidatus Bipolaricaulota bacterium]|nr:choice-of-anchor D domain-containing protein [Candidatus Bipolaricaulota bacterium]